ncbi:hypothetical protein SAMN02799631_01864 [Methylobacterium sp. 174MFSha1.1]|uniref:hypothetical protein n=1 Tax=Methylobacterium sp. 174MFSha1.1 TaxID=1502749 RepID=UPI0008F0A2D1|nr:hypothetical protein [Methylobacterium sp. 174MFSha1.1]SFU70683.1 hypothetical protein SAMN02799631_01864 [Methylobacterium sp. 174MFSha1.1]
MNGGAILDTYFSMVPALTPPIGHDFKAALHLVGLGSDAQDAIWVRLRKNAAEAAAEFADLDEAFPAIRTAEEVEYLMAA